MSDGMPGNLDSEQLRRLLDVGRSLVTDRDPEAVLQRVLDAARDLTGARYAALGVLDLEKRELEQFVFLGVDEELRRRIGELPRGHGILGELIRHPEPLRLSRLSEHPRSYGFPAAHPPMESFLGVPVMIHGEVYGNLYLTEKVGGAHFDERDEQLALVLAEWAAVAVDNARSHASGARRRNELERAARGMRATVSLNRDLGGETDLDRVLELVVKRGRALVEARFCLILLAEGEDLVVAAGAGEVPDLALGARLSDPGSIPHSVSREGMSRRLSRGAEELLAATGIAYESALLVPLRSRGEAVGVLLAADRHERELSFSADDELALDSFATAAATAIAAARWAESERVRVAIAASEEERRRWARELHDETLQDLGALRVMQESALAGDQSELMRRTLREAADQVDHMIEGLQGLITELRPAALDELGIGAATEALVTRLERHSPLQVELDLNLRANARLEPELEATVYRVVQEALTNVVKHAAASRARVVINEGSDRLTVTIEDDGGGFDPASTGSGFGLVGMRERVGLAGGRLHMGPGSLGGACVSVQLPTY